MVESTRKRLKKAAHNKPQSHEATLSVYLGAGYREAFGVVAFLIAIYFFAALLSFDANDPGWSYGGQSGVIENWAGSLGAWLADVLLSLMGYIAYFIPLGLIYLGGNLLRARNKGAGLHGLVGANTRLRLFIRSGALFFLLVASCGLSSMPFLSHAGSPESVGGIIGIEVAAFSVSSFGIFGGTLILLALALLSVTIAAHLSWIKLADKIGLRAMQLASFSKNYLSARKEKKAEEKQTKAIVQARKEVLKTAIKKQEKRTPPVIAKTAPAVKKSKRVERERQQPLFKNMEEGLPAVSLLDPAEVASKKGYSAEALEGMSRLLEIKLMDFNVEAQVVAVQPGPVITRFEIQPAAGIKVSKISGLAKDLARSLAVISVRVVEVIPGKTTVGIEIPNEHREMIRLSEIISSEIFDAATSPLTMALGKNISGEPVITDLGKMPHLLVAGTTGSGKSVGLNAMLMSLLFKASPEEVRLIMIDPKMLELAVYDDIPHLLTPVVTDMKEAASALRWGVAEMERRYKLLAAMGVRNLAGFNKKIKDAEKRGEKINDPLWAPADGELDQEPPTIDALPYIVIVVDEFADMMMIVGKKVEELIARIAQKARAAGIHLIIATQRPSVDVITGLIKANVPSRMAFQVSSKIDSRTVLDQGGAEQLLGHGDMLFLPTGASVPERVHGAFVDDDEVHRVCDDWRSRSQTNYLDEILQAPDAGAGIGEGDEGEEQDVLFDHAIAFVTQTRKVSISSVQRKFKIGYNRAARLVESMEMAGVVSEAGNNGSREVLAPPPVAR